MRGNEFGNSDIKLTQEGLKNGSRLASKGSILILVRGSMLFNTIPVGITSCDVAFNQDVKSITVNEENHTKYVLYWLIASENNLLNKVTGTGIGAGKLDLQDLKGLNICLPTLKEQQTIATFLTAVDTRIQQLSRKKALLEQYKKGVMQQLFSQQIRFKDEQGQAYPDWEEKRLGEIGVTYNGLTGKSKDNFGAGKPYVTYKQIFDKSRIDTSRFELVEIHQGENQNKVQFGDIFFTTSSETANEVGFSSVLLDQVGELYLNSFCFGFRPKSFEILVPKFAEYLFRSNLFRKLVRNLAQGSTRYNLSKVELMKLQVKLPSSEEQQKIATFLTAIDQKITRTNQQLQGIQQYKKGLLQQLFV